MAWIQEVLHKNGTSTFWVRDRREGRQIVLEAGRTKAEAQEKLRQYCIRRDLEKEGYDDQFAKPIRRD